MHSKTIIESMDLGLLLNEIEIDNENCDFRFINEYEVALSTLKRKFNNHEVVEEIKDALNKLKESSEDCRAFNAIKSEILANTGDEYLAENIAWELIYG